MILQALTEEYERLAEKGKVSRPGWCTAKVSWAIALREDGTVAELLPMKHSEPRGKKMVEVPETVRVPQMVTRSCGVKANFLCDNAKYMLGISEAKNDENSEEKVKREARDKECFAAAKELHLSLLEKAQSPIARAIVDFFRTWEPERAGENPVIAENWKDLTSGSNLVFWVDGQYVQEDLEISHIWDQNNQGDSEAGENEGICLVTGQRTEIARIHTAIKGVRGAQSSGAALVSFNAPAFESYGKEQSYNAPVGTYAMFAYTTALNYLLSQQKYVKQLGDTTVIYWAEDADEACQDLFLEISEPTPDNQEILEGVFKNLERRYAVDVDAVGRHINLEQKFYILGLSPNAARLSVRFFYADTFGTILRHLKEHYDRMEIIRPSFDNMPYLGVWRMLQETVNQKSRDKNPQPGMTGRVFSAMISGNRYPQSLYFSVLERLRAEQDDPDSYQKKVSRGRAAIIKAYLLRNTKMLTEKGESFVALNESCKDAAYVLGRQFAVLEAIQQDANPGINATIKDRYFNAACAAPAMIFPVLYKLKNSHVRKLSDGKRVWYERLLTELQGMLEADGIPQRLTLDQQGMFILGYYHQTQKRFEKKEEA